MTYNKKQHFADNISALRTAFELERSPKVPSAVQLAAMRRYSGFGGLKCVLYPFDSPKEQEAFRAKNKSLYPLVVQLHELLHEQSASEEQYNRYVEGLRQSVLTGFYTPPQIAGALAQVLEDHALTIGRLLDPSAGTGLFTEALSPLFEREAQAVSFEEDPLTALVFRHLHPTYTLRAEGFQRCGDSYADYFDVVATNTPFGRYGVFDPAFVSRPQEVYRLALSSIHNYYLVKAAEVVRPGGLIAFITTRGVMDSSENEPIRHHLMRHCNLVSAIRFPEGLFSGTAGTEVGSDLIVLQRDSFKTEPTSREAAFLSSVTDREGRAENSWFAGDLTHCICSERLAGTDPYGKPAWNYRFEGGPAQVAGILVEKLREDFKQYFSREMYEKHRLQKQTDDSTPQEQSRSLSQSLFAQIFDLEDPNKAEDSFQGPLMDHWSEGSYVVHNGQVGTLSEFETDKVVFTPAKLPLTQQMRMKAYIGVRDAYKALFETEHATGVEQPSLRESLRAAYDDFTSLYGDMNARSNARLLLNDPSAREVLSLERFVKGQKSLADIFERPVSLPTRTISHTDDPMEALTVCLNRYGRVDPKTLCQLTGQVWETLSERLSERIFYEPLSDTWQIKEKFIAGNIASKIEQIKAWMEGRKADPRVESSLAALEKALPEPVPFEKIGFNLGERWIPPQVYSQFATELFQTQTSVSYNDLIDTYTVEPEKENAFTRREFGLRTQWRYLTGDELMCYALYNTFPHITKTEQIDGKTYQVPDVAAMQQARQKIEQIQSRFQEWLFGQDEGFKKELAGHYNRLFNAIVIPEYDGSHLTLEDLNLKGLGYEKVHKSQKDAA